MNEAIATENTNWTDERIIDLVRKLRNDLIRDFLDERNIIAFLALQYNRKELSAVKITLMKHELKQMRIQPVDARHYQPLIHQIRETGTASISTRHEELFIKDVEQILKKYAL
jgi:hypothetical protein